MAVWDSMPGSRGVPRVRRREGGREGVSYVPTSSPSFGGRKIGGQSRADQLRAKAPYVARFPPAKAQTQGAKCLCPGSPPPTGMPHGF